MVVTGVEAQLNDSSFVVKDDRTNATTRSDDCTVNISYSISSMDRDTSHTSRDILDSSRLTVNTHTSILNITEEDEDEDDYEEARSFLFDDMAEDRLNQSLEHPPSISTALETPPIAPKHCCDPLTSPTSTEVTKRDTSLFDGITERFIESLCFPRDNDLAANIDGTEETFVAWDRRLEYDILELLGCANLPDEDEMEKVWAWNQSALFCQQKPDEDNLVSPPRPRRHSLRERALRVRRLRVERALPNRAIGLSPTPSPTCVIQHRTQSMDDHILQLASYHDSGRVDALKEDLEKQIGLGLDPIQPDAEELGYDSDPGEFSYESPVLLSPPRSSPIAKKAVNIEPEEPDHQTVQETFNFTWTLTWHPGKGVAHRNPMTITSWIERGTVVQKNCVMLEPNLMWREAYQPDLAKRKLNTSTQKPFSIRLLNICRIIEAPADFDRSIHPFARPCCSFILRTSDKKEYLFEAASEQEREDIIRRWKLSIARFATLAVMEDLEGIYKEFFTPMNTSQMLVPDYEL